MKKKLYSLVVLLLLPMGMLLAADPVPPKGFRSIFNGKDLTGWYGWNPHSSTKLKGEKLAANLKKQRAEFPKTWKAEDGELVNGGDGPYATSTEEYGDIELLIEYKTVAKADSGIYLRGTPQIQIWDINQPSLEKAPDRNPNRGSGGLFNNAPKSKGRDPLVVADKPFGEWNSFRIKQVGAHTWVWLNDKLVVDNAVMENFWDGKKALPAKGPIMLQTHGGEIRWRNIFVRDINAEEARALLVGTQPPTAYKAGAASVVITPEKPMWMAGYAGRNKPSEGKATELFAKALALEDEKGNRLVFVTMDLIGIPRTLRKSLETRARTEWSLPPESFVLNASHTHCGPEFRYAKTSADDGDSSRAAQAEIFGRSLEEKIVKLIGNAIANLKPCKLSYSFARCGFAMNRRLPANGDFRNSPYPEGPVDHEVPTLRVNDAEGKLKAVLFGYACHNTTLGFYQFCGDYAGFAQQYLEADHPGAIALFMTGCGGDQNPYPRGTLELAQKHGRSLATAVEAALANTMKPLNGVLRGVLEEIDLHYAPAPTKEEFSKRLHSKDTYEVAHAKRMLVRLEKGEKLPTIYPYPVQVIQLGDGLIMAALGGEVVVDYSLRLKKEIKGSAVWVAGYSNDVMGYIPSTRVLKEGGYEGGGAMRFSTTHPGPWADTAEEKIIEKVHALLKQLLSK